MNSEVHRIPTGDIVIYDDRDEACRYQVTCLRQWGIGQRLTLIPASDPRALIWFGTPEDVVAPGAFTYIGLDGSHAIGEEAIARILDALPSGKGRMLAVLLGDRAPGQGDPEKTLWSCDHQKKGKCDNACNQRTCFNNRGELRPVNRMGH